MPGKAVLPPALARDVAVIEEYLCDDVPAASRLALVRFIQTVCDNPLPVTQSFSTRAMKDRFGETVAAKLGVINRRQQHRRHQATARQKRLSNKARREQPLLRRPPPPPPPRRPAETGFADKAAETGRLELVAALAAALAA
jgi:hypothetical protein